MSTRTAAPIAVLGAGLAGLTAARFLRACNVPVVIHEAGKQVGGLARSFQEDGFTYDLGAHFITNRLAKEIGVLDQCRDVRNYGESVFLRGRHYSYPFGLLLSPRFAVAGLASRMPGQPRPEDAVSAAERFTAMYGRSLAEEVAIPLVEAWSGVPADELAASVADKIPISIARVIMLRIASRLAHRAIAIGYGRERPESLRVWHVYPEGGLSLLSQKLASGLKDAIRLKSRVEAIIVESGRAVALRINGKVHEVSAVISTGCCTMLPRLIEGTHNLDYLSRFRFRPMVFVMMRFVGRELLRDVVVWTPEPKFPFFRLTETPMSMPWLAPSGKTLITVDIGCVVGDNVWHMDEAQLGELCLDKIGSLIPDARQRYLGCRVLRTPIAYPVFLKEYEADRKRFRESTGIEFLYSIGRNGEFDHLLTEDVYWRTLAKMHAALPALASRTRPRSTSEPQGLVVSS